MWQLAQVTKGDWRGREVWVGPLEIMPPGLYREWCGWPGTSRWMPILEHRRRKARRLALAEPAYLEDSWLHLLPQFCEDPPRPSFREWVG